MTEHLPECPTDWCICSYLRRCEERVKRVERPLSFLKGTAYGRDCGWDEALNAAREAIKGVNWFNDKGKMLSAVVATAESLSAIDALREGDQP